MMTGTATTVSTDDDRRLAAQCAGGDTAAFEQLYRKHGDRMKSIAYNHLGNISDAEAKMIKALLERAFEQLRDKQ